MHVDPQWQPVFRELGIDADAVFDHPLIKPWRTLKDRENCVLDADLVDGRHVRWHVKRYTTTPPARREIDGLKLLRDRQIPTLRAVGWGWIDDGRSFVITDDLVGYEDAEKLIRGGRASFGQLLEPTADLAATLHDAGLHHRDLYLCHFFAKVDGGETDLKLIDVARVRQLPRFLGQRWVVKDLAQFWYSTTSLPVTDGQQRAWLARYCDRRGLRDVESLRRSIERKARWIARHDRSLRVREPTRNIAIPDTRV